MKPESRPGEIVITIAQQLQRLDAFFSVFSNSERTWEFICEYKGAIYLEISYRLQHGKKNEDFGSFEYLLEQAQAHIRENRSEIIPELSTTRIKKIVAKLKKLKEIQRSVSTVLEVHKEHGTDWIPQEFRKNAAISLLALPIMVLTFEASRVALVAALIRMNAEQFTSLIVSYYAIISVAGYIQEQKTLKHTNTLVFNPYVNLIVLGFSNQVASILVRAPKHAIELSAIVGAAIARGTDVSVISPVLGLLLTASLWGTADISFNFVQEKIQKHQKGKGV